jgi:hypothetical protein
MANDISSRTWFIDTPGAGVIYPYQVFIKFIEVIVGTGQPLGTSLADIRDRNNKSIVLSDSQTASSAGEIQTYNLENWFEGLIVASLSTGTTLRIHIKWGFMGVIRVKDGVQFTKIAPGGFRILSTIDICAASLPQDLTITSACDGEHSGPNDPHHRGEAYDVRSHDLAPNMKELVLKTIQNNLGEDHFYAFLEDEGTDNEHFHIQVKKGTEYPPSNINDVREAAAGDN